MEINDVYTLVNGQFIDQLCSVDNLFIRQLAHLAEEQAKEMKIVSFILKDKVNNRGEIAQRGVHPSEKSVIDLSKLTPLTQHFQAKNLLEEIAQYRADMLNFPEVKANSNWWKENEEILMVDYLLSSALCYVEVFDNTSRVEKFFATRNRSLVALLMGMEVHETAKYVNYLQSFAINYQSKQIKVLKMGITKNGFKVSQPRSYLDFNKSVKVTPLFLMTAFVEGISEVLREHIVRFKYIKDNLTEREFISTLSPQILLSFYQEGFVQKMLSGVGVQLNRGYIRLPELGVSKYDESGVRALNVSRLTQLEIISDFDASYIDVDFDTILPAFRETIMNMLDRNILSFIHKDLTGQDPSVESVPELRSILVSYVEGQVAIGTTTALRYLHTYMSDRKKFFPIYNGGKPIQYGEVTNSFNLGVVNDD